MVQSTVGAGIRQLDHWEEVEVRTLEEARSFPCILVVSGGRGILLARLPDMTEPMETRVWGSHWKAATN